MGLGTQIRVGVLNDVGAAAHHFVDTDIEEFHSLSLHLIPMNRSRSRAHFAP